MEKQYKKTQYTAINRIEEFVLIHGGSFSKFAMTKTSSVDEPDMTVPYVFLNVPEAEANDAIRYLHLLGGKVDFGDLQRHGMLMFYRLPQ